MRNFKCLKCRRVGTLKDTGKVINTIDPNLSYTKNKARCYKCIKCGQKAYVTELEGEE